MDLRYLIAKVMDQHEINSNSLSVPLGMYCHNKGAYFKLYFTPAP